MPAHSSAFDSSTSSSTHGTCSGLPTSMMLDPAVVDGLWSLVEPHLDEMHAFGAYGAPTRTTT